MKLFVQDRHYFPDPRRAKDDVVDVFDTINSEILLEAYSFGIFPWPYAELPLLWFCPRERGVIDFTELKIPTSFKKFYKHHPFEIRFNTQFAEVLKRCANVPRPGQTGTWITDELREAYVDFHKAGYAHSIEAWRDGRLVGGLYGVYVGGSFSGESMFFEEANASKVCLVRLIEVLKDNGLQWMDIQMVTDHTERFGGKLISRENFLQRLELVKVKSKPIHFPT